jgi:hypothetical protein
MTELRTLSAAVALAAGMTWAGSISQAEILAMTNYESKPAEALKAYA